NFAELRHDASGFCALAAALPVLWLAVRALTGGARRADGRLLGLGAACCLAIAAQFLIVWKHPGPRYLLPSIAAAGALLAWTFGQRARGPLRAGALLALQLAAAV